MYELYLHRREDRVRAKRLLSSVPLRASPGGRSLLAQPPRSVAMATTLRRARNSKVFFSSLTFSFCFYWNRIKVYSDAHEISIPLFLDLVFGFLESNEIDSIVNMKRKLSIEIYLLL